MVFSEANLQRDKRLFKGRGLIILTGSRYLGIYMDNSKTQSQWLELKVAVWVDTIITLTQVARKHLQAAYVGQ